ncbi:MAG: hydroxyacid dehydrogenase [Dethiobacter sp.]|nr:hydroxyacid dehydrogenase [Dethiobacter sp.]
MKKKILLMEPFHEVGYRVFGDQFDVQIASDTSVETMVKEIKGAHGVLVRVYPLTREMIEAADCLQVVAKHGVGVDNIDVEACTKKGILVVNTGDANSLSVAEHALAAIGALAKRVMAMDNGIRNNNWNIRLEYKAIDLNTKTLGLVGFGQIGKLLAQKARAAYNMNVIVYDPYVNTEQAQALGATLYDSLERLFAESDVISLHAPHTPQTRNMIGEKLLSLMKPSAYFINFARGEIVDEKALYNILKAKKIAGAAVDVYQQEPTPPVHPFFELDNILLSPHSAVATQECIVRTATAASQGIVDVLQGRKPKFISNPQAWKE